MKNLAGCPDPDPIIIEELERAQFDIERLPRRSQGEVNSSIRGRLFSNCFYLRRAWSYWVMIGLVPLESAAKLYADPVGKKDIRVAGHCGCPAPIDPWLTYLDHEGHEMIKEKTKQEFEAMKLTIPENWRFVPERRLYKPFVTSYHVDTEVGLRILSDTLREFSFHEMCTYGDWTKKVLSRELEPRTKPEKVLEYRIPVRTVESKTTAKDWSAAAWQSRKWGVEAEIRHHELTNGLSYRVHHADHSEGWYAPEEIEVLSEVPVRS